MLSGGIVALICDEVMADLAVLRHGRPAVTTSMPMRYDGVIEIDGHNSCHATDGAGAGAGLPLRGRTVDLTPSSATADRTATMRTFLDEGLPAEARLLVKRAAWLLDRDCAAAASAELAAIKDVYPRVADDVIDAIAGVVLARR